MVYSLTYRRPPHVDSARASMFGDEKPKSVGETSIDSQGSGPAFGIPDALSFDRIIAGGTCPVSMIPFKTLCSAIGPLIKDALLLVHLLCFIPLSI